MLLAADGGDGGALVAGTGGGTAAWTAGGAADMAAAPGAGLLAGAGALVVPGIGGGVETRSDRPSEGPASPVRATTSRSVSRSGIVSLPAEAARTRPLLPSASSSRSSSDRATVPARVTRAALPPAATATGTTAGGGAGGGPGRGVFSSTSIWMDGSSSRSNAAGSIAGSLGGAATVGAGADTRAARPSEPSLGSTRPSARRSTADISRVRVSNGSPSSSSLASTTVGTASGAEMSAGEAGPDASEPKL